MVFDSFFNAIFGSLISKSPFWSIVLISLIFTSIVTLVYRLMTNQEVLRTHKKDLKRLRDEMNEAKNDQQRLMELQKQSMEIASKQFRHTLTPTFVTFIPLLIAFSWMRDTFNSMGPIALGLSWIWIYIICSFVFSLTIRKIFKIA